ncbi:MAG: sugar ABC transporter permease [Clostridiales bacterium]|nr:sugar ABC transporter permease [Clostridiales bacterium]
MIVCSKKEKINYYFFLVPAFLVFSIFIFWPLIQSLYLSFFKYNIININTPQFVGLKNYSFILHDQIFWTSIVNTVIYVLGTIPLKLLFGLLLALAVNSKFIKFKTFYRTSFYMPVICSMVAVSIVWSLLFNPGPNGIVNIILSKFKINPLGWGSDSNLSLLTVMLLGIWKEIGYVMMIYLSGLMAIPQDIYEAASLDPVSSFQKFMYLTLPLLRPTTIFLLITEMIGSFQVFTPIYVITGGGPGYSSTTIINYLYNKGFQEYSMGQACAVAYVLFAVLLLLTILQNKFSKSEEVSYD